MSIFKFYRNSNPILILMLCIILCNNYSCNKKQPKKVLNTTKKEPQLFKTIAPSKSGINFINTLEETLESNYYQYLYAYIGGGVAAGDINNDGLIDLYFTSNQAEDKLYLNKGNFNFEDITATSGINHNEGFNAGVTMVDINNDGFQDIYISRGGWKDDNNKFSNLLFINNGDNTFTEKAKQLGLDDSNRSIQASFFDYDNDNDLDVYISNTPDSNGKIQIVNINEIYKNPKTLKSKGSDKFYINDGNGHFIEASKKVGLVFDLGFGLNPQVGDLNNDGWLDIYVCNDFNSPDLAYINNKDGTFTESSKTIFKHTSFYSMGSDIADVNNDGLMDLLTLDMNPEDYIRSKTTMAMTSVNKFELMVENGYHHQYMHNMLQLNNGNGTFSEISKMSQIGDTDWSWAILLEDFDLDGLNDVFVTNGVFRDVIDQDSNAKILAILRKNGRKPTKEDFLNFSKMLPQQKLKNYFFKNKGNLTFLNTSDSWSNMEPTFSNGAVYADLDNDGDLDIVVNNINEEATVMKNMAVEHLQNNFLKINFKGPKKNSHGVGVIANLFFKDGSKQTKQIINSRGFLSSVSNTLNFGLKKQSLVNKIEILWPDRKSEILKNVKANQTLIVEYKNAMPSKVPKPLNKEKLFDKLNTNYKHIDPYYNDFNLQVLLPHKLSQTGPALAKADVNNDGIEDVFIGGANGYSGQLLVGNKLGEFKLKENKAFALDKKYEDTAALFFDADNDGDQDLYISSGSYEFYGYPKALQDRIYMNDGTGLFEKLEGALPKIISAGSTVTASDYDGDGDMDLFVGGRVIPGKYPHAPKSYLLQNNQGKFIDKTAELAHELITMGMITDAIWTDINNDLKTDLIVTGEWMGIEVFINKNGKLLKTEKFSTLKESKGWWNKLLITDVDNDGDKDIIAGNLGLNYKFHASKEKPFHVYTNDFNFDNVEDIVLAKKYKGQEVPIRGKTCMTQQMPHLAQKIPNYNDFASKNLEDILGKRLKSALHYKVTEFKSGIFINNGNTSFTFSPFSNNEQKSPINSILFEDVNNDGYKDLILAGNNYMSEVETTRADAGIGSILLGNGNGNFKNISHLESGFFVDGDVRNMELISMGKKNILFVVNNNSNHSLFKMNK